MGAYTPITSCRRPGFGCTRATTIFVLPAMMCPFLKAIFPFRRAMVCFPLLPARLDNSAARLVANQLVRTSVATRFSAVLLLSAGLYDLAAVSEFHELISGSSAVLEGCYVRRCVAMDLTCSSPRSLAASVAAGAAPKASPRAALAIPSGTARASGNAAATTSTPDRNGAPIVRATSQPWTT